MSSVARDYTGVYDPDTDFDSRYTTATVARVAERITAGQRVLELGCATGLMTCALLAAGAAVTAVDRSPGYLARARARAADAVLVQAGLEDADWEQRTGSGFDHVLACNLIHEMDDPVALLARARDVLAEGGLVHLSLQNPASIHRLVALEMGLIGDLRDISERGARFDTLGLWTADELGELGRDAGLEVVAREGVMLKPLPNAMMAELPPEVLDGFERAARHLPEHCAMTYLVLARA